MKTRFKPNTLGEAFVLAIKEDHDNDSMLSFEIKDAGGDTTMIDPLPFKGIEQVNRNLANNPQYMDIPVWHYYNGSTDFKFPRDLDWRKYAPKDFDFTEEDKYGCDFRDTFLGSILPDDDPYIAVKARNRIYVLDGEEGTFWISSFKEIDFKPAEFSGLLDAEESGLSKQW